MVVGGEQLREPGPEQQRRTAASAVRAGVEATASSAVRPAVLPLLRGSGRARGPSRPGGDGQLVGGGAAPAHGRSDGQAPRHTGGSAAPIDPGGTVDRSRTGGTVHRKCPVARSGGGSIRRSVGSAPTTCGPAGEPGCGGGA